MTHRRVVEGTSHQKSEGKRVRLESETGGYYYASSLRFEFVLKEQCVTF